LVDEDVGLGGLLFSACFTVFWCVMGDCGV